MCILRMFQLQSIGIQQANFYYGNKHAFFFGTHKLLLLSTSLMFSYYLGTTMTRVLLI